MKDFVLEACVDSVESALAAVKGGANRLELCSNLVIGGTTPSQWLYEEIRKESDIRIHALIRPRFGDFCYTDHEFEIIRNEVRMFRKLGAEGVVIGILRPDGTLNMEEMEKLMEDAGDMSVTLHRAFDVCRNPYETFEQAKRLGISTILTSGQKNSCVAGKELLRELVAMEKGEITDWKRRGCSCYPGAPAVYGSTCLPYDRKSRAGEQHAVPQGRRQYGTAVLKRV